jgi:hypothetical protein
MKTNPDSFALYPSYEMPVYFLLSVDHGPAEGAGRRGGLLAALFGSLPCH